MTKLFPLKIKLFIIPFILLFSSVLLGQEGLLIKNKKTGRTWIFKKNSRITYIRYTESEYNTGKLNDLLDSAVVIGKDTVPMKDIAGIRKKNHVRSFARIAGLPLMLIGTLFMGQGVAGMISNSNPDTGIKTTLLGVGIFSLGYIPYELSPEDLIIGIDNSWTIEIQRINQ